MRLIIYTLLCFLAAYTHFQNVASFFQNFTQKSKNCTQIAIVCVCVYFAFIPFMLSFVSILSICSLSKNTDVSGSTLFMEVPSHGKQNVLHRLSGYSQNTKGLFESCILIFLHFLF